MHIGICPREKRNRGRIRHRHPLSHVTDTRVYDECFSFLPDAFTWLSVTFPPPDVVCVRSRVRPRTICNFPLDMHQEFRDVYPRSMPSRDCRRGERWRAEINLGQSPPFSFREKETAAFPSFPPRPLVPHVRTAIESQRSCAIREIRGCIQPRILVCDAFDG